MLEQHLLEDPGRMSLAFTTGLLWERACFSSRSLPSDTLPGQKPGTVHATRWKRHGLMLSRTRGPGCPVKVDSAASFFLALIRLWKQKSRMDALFDDGHQEACNTIAFCVMFEQDHYVCTRQAWPQAYWQARDEIYAEVLGPAIGVAGLASTAATFRQGIEVLTASRWVTDQATR